MSLASAYQEVKTKAEQERQQGVGGLIFANIAEVWKTPPMTVDSWVRVSSLGKFCAREEVLCAIHNITREFQCNAQLRWILDQGTMIHHLYRDWYLGPIGNYLGSWLCIPCGKNTDGDEVGSDGYPVKSMLPKGSMPETGRPRVIPMPKQCPNCGGDRATWDGTRLIVFHEWLLCNEEHRIRGKQDGFRLDGGEVIGQEAKSISPNGFRKRRTDGPYVKDKTQAMTYLWLSGMKRGEIVYLNKSGWKKPDKDGNVDPREFVLSFPIEYSKAWMESYVWGPVSKARKAIKAGTLPKRICAKPGVPRTVDCPMVELCFKEADGE
jgi:hypothetical protein